MENHLWSDLPLDEQGKIMHLFLTTAPSSVVSLDVGEIIYILQWTFEQRRIHVREVSVQESFIDLAMTNRSNDENEFTRLYLPGKDFPTTALYDLLSTLEGKNYKRVRFWTFGSFPPAQKSLQDEYPLLVEERDGEGLTIWFREAQEYYHRKPASSGNANAHGKKDRGVLKRFKRKFKA
jgi:hypothetical protein